MIYTHPVPIKITVGPMPDAFGSFVTPAASPSIKWNPYLYVHTLDKRILYVGEAASLGRIKRGFTEDFTVSSAYKWRQNYAGKALTTYAFKLTETVFLTEKYRRALEAEVVLEICVTLGNWPSECHGLQPQADVAKSEVIQERKTKILNQLKTQRINSV